MSSHGFSWRLNYAPRQLVSLLFKQPHLIDELEVLVQLVLATVFKTVGPHGNHVAGGFDSHALPPSIALALRGASHGGNFEISELRSCEF